MSADAPAQATCTSGRARCHAGRPHDPPPCTRYRISTPGGEPTHPSTPLCCPGLLLSPGQGRCAWAPCGAHAFCLTRCPARARAGSNGSCTSGRGSNRGQTSGGPAGNVRRGLREFDFCERAPAGTNQGEGGMGGRRRRPTRWRQWAKVRITCRRASTRSSIPG